MTKTIPIAEHKESRVIRVFVSSTFRDMQAERDELAKFIFPQLRKLCERRAVTWGEVDLRWGITDEQKSEGKVLPICLEEIRRCRPYFIGLLGERYGWIPDEVSQELVESEPWLAEHHDCSVTELEILHGVLNDQEMADHAFFYFRNPAFIDSQSASEQSVFREMPSPEEIQKHGEGEARQRAEKRKQKLQSLKQRIRTSGLPVQENYRDPKQLGEWVLRDLTAIIDRLYPEGIQLNRLDRDAADHEAFARSRAGVYIGRQEYFDRLDAHVQSDEQPLVVLGESGGGKSALLANWAMRYRARLTGLPTAPQESLWTKLSSAFRRTPPGIQPFLLMHFIGASPDSADWVTLVRRVMGEFKRRFDIREEIPDKPDALRAAFANWLHMAAARGRVVLILDALNQLEDREGALDLFWLPPMIPANVRMIVSTLPSRPLNELNKRGWPTLCVEPLSIEERKQLIEKYLAQYTKVLGQAQMERVAHSPQTANPLFLRAFLEELRIFGVHEQLDTRIEYYLASKTIDELYERILERYEADYERDRPGLVRDAMSLLWAARRGLSETEMLEMLGTDGQPMPHAYWSPLYLAAEQSLVNRSGLIGFFHDHIRQAIRNRYLSAEQMQQAAHLRLADYFNGHELGARTVDEEPWQLAQAKAWQRLYTLLANLTFFNLAWRTDHFEVLANWAKVEINSGQSMVEAYQLALSNLDQSPECLFNLSHLLGSTGHPAEASLLRARVVEHFRKIGDQGREALVLDEQGTALFVRGDLDAAMNLLEEAERLYNQIGDKRGLPNLLNHQALILWRRGNLGGAMKLHKQVERLCRETGNQYALADSFRNQALILWRRGELDEAMRLHKAAAHLCHEVGNKQGLSDSLGNQALILRARGDLDGAMKLYQEGERVCRELGNKETLVPYLGNRGVILKMRDDLDGAMKLFEEGEGLCRELGMKKELATSLYNQATILTIRRDGDGAMKLFEEAEHLCREVGHKQGLADSLCSHALLLWRRGDLDEAMGTLEEAERLFRELGSQEGLVKALFFQASILEMSMHQSLKALDLADKALDIATACRYAPLAEDIESLRKRILGRTR